jgi:hypothetical protein
LVKMDFHCWGILDSKLVWPICFTGLKAAKSTRVLPNEQLTEEQVIERVANNYYQVYVRRQNLNVLDSTHQY